MLSSAATPEAVPGPESVAGAPAPPAAAGEGPFDQGRDFRGNRFVYAVVSPRARGLSIGVNLNPDRQCDYSCTYCEVDRAVPAAESRLDLDAMAAELQAMFSLVRSGGLRDLPGYERIPAELLELRHVALSGDGEPTLSPDFLAAVETVVHLRARGPFFKIVLVTNGSGLGTPQVEEGLRLLTGRDEIWAKLDGGTQAYLDRVNRPGRPIEDVLAHILALARRRPVVIQSLFPSLHGAEPPREEIEAYAHRLRVLKQSGAQIPLVQIYSATRPAPRRESGHLPLRSLSQIARRVREVAGLPAEVF
jgi:wyosine [tRNA(Phe)-imidazoG37] synthetase (radical SAM superfamily)